MRPFRVALSADFLGEDGAPTYPTFDLSPLTGDPTIEMGYVPWNADGIMEAGPLAEYDALILLAKRFTAASIPANGRLGLIARFGVGFDAVDLAACAEAGIAVATTPDGMRRPLATAIITFVLALAGRMMIKDKLTRQGPEGFARRADYMGMGLVGRTLCSIGIGNVGAEMFRLARPFDMKFVAYSRNPDPALAAELGIELVEQDEVFRRSDFVTLNCPLTPQTYHLVNAERLALMKPEAYLINTARGDVVDQAALTHALQEGRIAGAGLDVLSPEPPDANDPILALDNVIFAPHALCWTDQCFSGTGAADVRAVLDFRAGRVPESIVNPAVLDNPIWKGRLADAQTRTGG